MKIYAWWVVTAPTTITEFHFSQWRICFGLARLYRIARPQLFIRTGGHIWGPF